MEPTAPSEALWAALGRCAAIRILVRARLEGTLEQANAVEAELGRLIETLTWADHMLHGIATVNRAMHDAQRKCIACVRLAAYPHAIEASLRDIERNCAMVLGRVGR